MDFAVNDRRQGCKRIEVANSDEHGHGRVAYTHLETDRLALCIAETEKLGQEISQQEYRDCLNQAYGNEVKEYV